MAKKSDIDHLRHTIRVSQQSRDSGNHPFGAIVVGPEGEVLAESGNTFSIDKGVGHAEMNVARAVAARYPQAYLARCTLYTSVEPCCMCAGATYWAGIGALVFGLSEKRLAQLTGDDPENLTMDMPCRQVFSAGQRQVEVRGPFKELEAEIVEAHDGFWSAASSPADADSDMQRGKQ